MLFLFFYNTIFVSPFVLCLSPRNIWHQGVEFQVGDRVGAFGGRGENKKNVSTVSSFHASSHFVWLNKTCKRKKKKKSPLVLVIDPPPPLESRRL